MCLLFEFLRYPPISKKVKALNSTPENNPMAIVLFLPLSKILSERFPIDILSGIVEGQSYTHTVGYCSVEHTIHPHTGTGLDLTPCVIANHRRIPRSSAEEEEK